LKNNTNVCVNEILYNPFTLVPLIKVFKNPKIQMEHQYIYFQIQIEPNSTSYICTNFLQNINENKPPLYQVLNKKFRKKINIIKRMSYFKTSF